MPVTGGMGLAGRLPLMAAFRKHSAFRAGGGHRFTHCPAAGTVGCFAIIVFLPQLLPFRRRFLPKLLPVRLCRSRCLFLLIFLFVARRLDVRSVYKHHLRRCHLMIQRFVQNMRKDFPA